METLDPNSDAENRYSVGGRKRSNRRSSILKTAKSPMKMALEDIDPNSLGGGMENRDKKTQRHSSSRRVSFAETYQVKEFCKDEEWTARWQKEKSTTVSDQAEQSDLTPSEYRQPTDVIKGLESLLKGDIQNTGQELEQVDPTMDFTFCGNITEQSGRQPHRSLEGYNQDQEHRNNDEMNALELTCHGQGLINQDDGAETDVFKHYYQSSGSKKESILAQDMRRPGVSEYVQDSKYYQTQTEKVKVSTNKENEGMDFTVCHGDRFVVQMSSQTIFSNNKTVVFDPNSKNVDLNPMELTCHGQGLVSHPSTCTPKFKASSFLQSLGKKPSQPKENYQKASYVDPGDEASQPLYMSLQHQQKQEMDNSANAKSFLASLGKSKVGVSQESASNTSIFGQQNSSYAGSSVNTFTLGSTELTDVAEPEEDMEMTACLDGVQNSNSNAPVQEERMDMTACVPPFSRLQDNPSTISDGQMDMTACVPPALRLQNNPSAISEGQMDMTACVPPVSRLQDNPSTISEGQMDMTACVPPALRLQDNPSTISEGQMDMTACVPPALRLQNNPSAISEGQMDMTACVPPVSRLQDNPSTISEGQMDMTTCIPPALRLQDNPSTISEGQMDMTACVPPVSRLQDNPSTISESQMDMTACVPPVSRLQDNPSTISEGQMDMTACVPPALRLQDNPSTISEGQMDMTACVPPALRLQDDPSAISEGQMDMTACVPPVSFPTVATDEDHSMDKRNQVEEEGMEMTIPIGKVQLSPPDEYPTSGDKDYVLDGAENDFHLQPASSLVYQTDSRKRQSSTSIDSTLQSEISSGKKKQLENHQDHHQRTNDVSSYNGPASTDSFISVTSNNKLGSSIQGWLNQSMPILQQKKTQASFLKSLPTLSRSLMESDDAGNKKIPHATFAPVSNVPISKFCMQPAMKRKMIQIDHQELPVLQSSGIQGLSQLKCKTEEQTFASSSVVDQENGGPKDSFKPDNAMNETAKSCHEGVPQEDDDDEVITFKDPVSSMAGLLGDNVTGLMDEPTLEMDLTDQSVLSEALNAINGTNHQEDGVQLPHQPSDDHIPSNTQSHDQSQYVAKQQARNLSVISEENENNSSKVTDRTLMTGKQETLMKQKNMTVAELLSRANISFHNIEQISRRSTIALMKKMEKPKGDKEFIQLSMVKKPQAISYGDICTNIQRELEKLKAMMDQKETELNESNASIFQQVDDSKMAKVEVTLKELKTICKKCAYRKWIRRTGTMKKKLALTLKENYEVLSNDVRNVDETLLVTNDCLKLIDGIDDEIEKGMESLRKSIEESETENAELDKVEATLHEKKSELESREGELKQMENQRSSLASSKETLASEKETLEREQLAHDEMLSQLRNKPSFRENNESLSEKYKWIEGCLEWELTEWNQNHAKFGFLYGTLELHVDFDQSDVAQSCSSQPVAKKIQNVSVSSQLADDSQLSARFVHSLVINSLDKELLHSANSNSSSLLKVLEHVSGLVIAARSLGNELFELNFQHILTMNGNSIFIEFSSVKAFMKFIVQFTINVCKYPDEVEITVIPKIGKCCVQEIQDALTSVPTGPKYVSRIVETARQFLDKK